MGTYALTTVNRGSTDKIAAKHRRRADRALAVQHECFKETVKTYIVKIMSNLDSKKMYAKRGQGRA